MRSDAESKIISYIEDSVFVQRVLPTPDGLLNSTGMTQDDLGDGSSVRVILSALQEFSDSEIKELFEKIREHRDLPLGFELLTYLVAQIELSRGVRGL